MSATAVGFGVSVLAIAASLFAGTLRAEEIARSGPVLRMAGGAAYLQERVDLRDRSPGAVYTGFGPSLEIAVGKRIAPRLLLAASWQSAGLFNREQRYLGQSYELSGTLHWLNGLGLLVDYNPDRWRRLELGGGLGALAATEVDTVYGAHHTSWGAIVSVHVGWKWRLSARWSASLLGRVSFYWYERDDPAPGATASALLPTLSLAFTFD